MRTLLSSTRRTLPIVLAVVMTACSGDDGVSPEPIDPTDPTDPVEVPLEGVRTVPIQVTLPPGVNLDLTTTMVSSAFGERPVSSAGASEATVREGTDRALISLTDDSGEPLLLGFVTDSRRELSASSTAEVAFYLGMGTILLPELVKARYVDEAATLPGFDDFVAEVVALFAADRHFLESEPFRQVLQSYVEDATEPGDVQDPARVRLTVPGEIRSGVQLEEQPGDAVVLINTYRRRAHAFFYRTRSTDLNGVETVHIQDIVGSEAPAGSDVIVPTPFAATSVKGTLQNWASGKGIEVARKESTPTVLALDEGDRAVRYAVRVVGPAEGEGELTAAEQDRLQELYVETLAFDVALPILMAIIDEDSFLAGVQESRWSGFFQQFKNTVQALPEVNDALTDGDLGAAMTAFIEALGNAAASALFQELYEKLIVDISQAAGGFTLDQSATILQNSERFFRILSVVDKLMQVGDYDRLLAGYTDSNTLEEFDVLVTRDNVRLDPRETLVIQGEEKVFTATVQDGQLPAGESYEYRWSISESYGELRSKSSTATGGSIVSSSNQVGYFSSNVTTLPEEARDTITVEVWINHGTGAPDTRVGEAKAAIEIEPLGFTIEPNEITIEGGTRLRLHTRRTDGTDPTAGSTLDYRFVWSTAGSYGMFEGTQRDVSVVNDNTIVYEALDRASEDATEDVEVSIHARRKGTSDPFRFVDRVSAEIRIDNDPLEDSYFVDFVTVGDPPYVEDNGIYCTWGVGKAVFLHPSVPPAGLEVVSHAVTIVEAPGWNAILGTGQTWLAENAATEVQDSLAVFSGIEGQPDSVHTEVEEDVYVFPFGGSGSQGGVEYCSTSAPADFARGVNVYDTFVGRAQVVVTFRYREEEE